MSNNNKNNNSQVQKQKIIVLSIMGVIVLIMGIFVISLFSDDKPKDEFSDLDVPGEENIEFESKLGGLEKGEELEKKKKEDENINLDFDDVSFNEDTINKKVAKVEEEELSFELDNKKKQTKNIASKPTVTKTSTSTNVTYSKPTKPKNVVYNNVKSKNYNTNNSSQIVKNSNVVVQNEPQQQQVRRRRGFVSSDEEDNSSNSNNGNNSNQQGSHTKSIKAIIHGQQKVVEGALVKLRLMEAINIGSTKYNNGSIIYGIADIQNGRVVLKISNQGLQESDVYDANGGKGIIIQGSINQQIGKDGADALISTGGTKITTPLGSFSTDALKKKNNENSVILHDHYPVIIKL